MSEVWLPVVVTKPPYRVPSMAEIATRVGTNGLTVVSTFSGCGGSCLGFKMAGYEPVWASEFVPAAAETYRANHPGVPLDESDIRDVTGDDIRAVVGDRPIDVLEGSPPCASFSTAGAGAKHWGKQKQYSDRVQRTDDLFFEFARLLDDLQPRAFVAENVPGLVKGKAKGYFIEILAALRGCGYRVEAKVLDASWLGVPQRRQRLIFVGTRIDLDTNPPFPQPLPYSYSIREAFDDLDAAVEDATDFSRFAIGAAAQRLRPGDQSDRYFQLVRPYWSEPSPTVTATAANTDAASVIHPDGERKFSLAELRRLCGFPDDFALPDDYSKAAERLGRAVPPPMMAAVATQLASVL